VLNVNKVITGMRWFYALFYITMGVLTFLFLAGLISMPNFEISPQNAVFQEALKSTGFIVPIMALTYVVSGGLMLFRRTAPLGIVLLAPFVLVILFTHLFLNGRPAWGIMHACLLLLFAWQFRSAFVPLWSYK
jgi:hypothetical protein